MSLDATLPRHDNPLSDRLPAYRSLLEEQWRRQVANIVELSYDLHSPVSDESDDEPRGNGLRVTARLLFAARKHLQETEEAIARVDDGSYGLCGDCRAPIPQERLEILPSARYCVACQARSDNRG